MHEETAKNANATMAMVRASFTGHLKKMKSVDAGDSSPSGEQWSVSSLRFLFSSTRRAARPTDELNVETSTNPLPNPAACVNVKDSHPVRLESGNMPRIVRCSIIQASNAVPATEPLAVQKQAMIDKHQGLIRKAASEGAQIVCLQEIFNGPYFCAEQSIKWYETTEPVPSGPTVSLMQSLAKELRIAMVVPVYEVEQEGIFYNTAAVLNSDGDYLGKYRKTHIPHVAPGFWEKFYFRPGNMGYPVFDLGFAKIGVYICYDRHFPEGARCLGLNGAEIVFNPSATVAGLSEYLWRLEQPAHAAANGYFIAAINRVGTEPPWNIGEFYGSSYFANPRGQIIAQASRDHDEVLTTDLNLDEIAEVRRTWQFFRDRRPDLYGPIVAS
jgi:beta-ureidopropionase